jgi:hypothetical protein
MRERSDRHLYEVVYLLEDGTEMYGGFYEVGTFVSEKAGEGYALSDAKQMMGDDAAVDAVRIYHTHPSPGPTRRYVGIVRRDVWKIERPR